MVRALCVLASDNHCVFDFDTANVAVLKFPDAVPNCDGSLEMLNHGVLLIESNNTGDCADVVAGKDFLSGFDYAVYSTP